MPCCSLHQTEGVECGFAPVNTLLLLIDARIKYTSRNKGIADVDNTRSFTAWSIPALSHNNAKMSARLQCNALYT